MLYIFKKLHFLYSFYDFFKNMCYNVFRTNIRGVKKIMEKLELTLENVEKIKNESNRALIRYVCGYVIDK